MSDISPILSLPRMQPSQAQKHVVHNEALRLLDVLVQAAVQSRKRSAPPAEPAEGDRHIVAAGASGGWAGQAGRIAARVDGAWMFLEPRAGWTVHVIDEAASAFWSGTQWITASERGQQFAKLGIGTPADDVNRLAVASEASLFNHAGAGHRISVNKAAAGDTASLILQTGFSGRAEMGLAGNDDFSIKVSPNGGQWTEALRLSGATGRATGAAVQSGPLDAAAGRLMTTGAFGVGAAQLARVTNLNTLAASGTYGISAADAAQGGVPSAGEWVCVHAQYDSQFALQEAQRKGDAGRWHRHRNGTTWSAWSSAYQRETIVGPVSQTGGALIERGSNASGEYMRLADGTQICIGRVVTDIATAVGGVFRSGPITWAFPAAFAANSAVAGCYVQGRVLHASGMTVNAPYGDRLTSCEDIRAYAVSAISNVGVQMMAVGRWF